MTDVRLICPVDRTILEREATGYRCSVCSREYPVIDGVVKFLEGEDAFYEGTYLNQIHFVPKSESVRHTWPLWLINNGYVWRVRRHTPPGGTLLELGCAGGVEYFARRYTTIGLDVSMTSLRSAARFYELCIQADAGEMIPLSDASVDTVASSFFWEHIPPALKTAMLKELHRVLKPGGRLVFVYDVETRNPLVNLMREKSERQYQAEFIEKDGHLGYEGPDVNVATFADCGFRIVEQLGLEKTPLQSTTVYGKLKRWPGALSKVGSALSMIERSRPVFFSYIGLLRLIDESVGRVLPSSWSRMALTVCEKR